MTSEQPPLLYPFSTLPSSIQPHLSTFGGKALKAYELFANGFPVPEAAVLPSSTYNHHMQKFQLEEKIQIVVQSGQHNANVDELLKEIRAEIFSAPLDSAVVRAVEGYLNTLPEGSSVSVRSSGTSEDKDMASFAGQYDTVLNQWSVDDVLDGVRTCWASMWKAHLLKYREERESETEKAVVPEMAVLLMRQIPSESAGVCFTMNPVTGARDELVIESVFGQGTGLVDGAINPDRFVVARQTGDLREHNVADKKFKFELNPIEEGGGVRQVALSPEQSHTCSLTKNQLKTLVQKAVEILQHYGYPQDIEWAFVGDQLYILQTRAITTANNGKGGNDAAAAAVSQMANVYGRTQGLREQFQNMRLSSFVQSRPVFTPPGPGFWELDVTHFAKPVSSVLCNYPDHMIKGFRSSTKRMGCLIDTVVYKIVNGFFYMQMAPVTDPEEAGRRIAVNTEYWNNKQYLKDHDEFYNVFVPTLEKETLALQDRVEAADALNNADTFQLWQECKEALLHGFERHHTYTIQCLVPIGDFLVHTQKWTGAPVAEALGVFEGHAPTTRGIMGTPEGADVVHLIQKNPSALTLLQSDKTPEGIVSLLLSWDAEDDSSISAAMKTLLRKRAWRLVSGYDITDKTLLECPDLIVASLISGLDEERRCRESRARSTKCIASLRSRVPPEHVEEWDEMIKVALLTYPMRDERGLYSDLWSTAVFRILSLKMGDHLVSQGHLPQKELFLEASLDEMEELWKGLDQPKSQQDDDSDSSDDDDDKVCHPLTSKLRVRAKYRNHTGSEAPVTLGGPRMPPPDMSTMPPVAARTFAASFMVVSSLFAREEHLVDDPNTIQGIPASCGVSEGDARVIVNVTDFSLLQDGEIIVTYSTSAAFNSILPKAKAIVADYGGTLSHAAIVSREFGIPCVTSCLDAVETIKNGSRIRVDGTHGTVTILSDAKAEHRVSSVQAEKTAAVRRTFRRQGSEVSTLIG